MKSIGSGYYQLKLIEKCPSELTATRGGTRVLNNYISKVIHSHNPKHTTGEYGWNVFWHNTVYDSAYWAVSTRVSIKDTCWYLNGHL